MIGAFACPDCGQEVSPQGLSPGRRVHCPECSTLLEVPFLPRVSRRRCRPGRPRSLVWPSLGLTLATVALVAVGLGRAWQSGERADHARALATLMATAREAEAAGRFDRALSDAEAALALARERKLEAVVDLVDFRRRRDVISLREAESRLTASGHLDGPAAIGDLLGLWSRAETDEALAPVLERVATALAQRASAELAAARDDLSAGRAGVALDRCERAWTAVEPLPTTVGGAVRDEAEGLARAIVEGYGVVVEPFQGQFTLGTTRAYEADLRPIVAETLRGLGYLLPPRSRSPFRALWSGGDVAHLAVALIERQDVPFGDTRQQASRIECRLALSQGGRPVWSGTTAGRTGRHQPSLATHGAFRVAMTVPRDPGIERRLYDDARGALLRQVPLKLRELPNPAGAAPVGR